MMITHVLYLLKLVITSLIFFLHIFKTDNQKMDAREFILLTNYLAKIPAINIPIATGSDEQGLWWVKFQIDIDNDLAWHVVQELGCVVNYLSINERLPTVFYPVSPAPYSNGGPAD